MSRKNLTVELWEADKRMEKKKERALLEFWERRDKHPEEMAGLMEHIERRDKRKRRKHGI